MKISKFKFSDEQKRFRKFGFIEEATKSQNLSPNFVFFTNVELSKCEPLSNCAQFAQLGDFRATIRIIACPFQSKMIAYFLRGRTGIHGGMERV